MYPVSDAFNQQLLASSRQWATKIDIIFGTQIVTTLNVLVDGYISMDNVAVRREAHFTIVDADGTLTPASANDLLAPKGTEIRVYRGLYVPDVNNVWSYEYVPMGVFGLVEPAVRSNEEGTQIDIKGFDRIDRLRNLHFEDPWVVADGTYIHTALAAIVADRMPDVTIQVTPSTYTTPAVVFDRLSSPWDAVRTLIEASGFLCYFDPVGTCIIEPYTETYTGVTYTTGDQGLLMESDQTFAADTTYSGVIVRGQHPDYSPIRAETWDTDPTSPTYSLGPFGRRPYGVYSELIINQTQAQAISDATFAQVTQMAQEVQIYTRGGPQHDVGDLITVVDERVKVNGTYVLKSATIPIKNVQGNHVRLLMESSALGTVSG